MSRSFGMITEFGVTLARVANAHDKNPMTYIPAHINSAGKKISQRIVFEVFINGQKNSDGSEGRKDRFKCTLWGPRADTAAIVLHKGMACDLHLTAQSYRARIYTTDANGNRVPEKDAAGVVMTRWDVGFNVERIAYAEEASAWIEEQVQQGKRPPYWYVKDHQHYAAYSKIIEDNKAAPKALFDINSPMFGFAKVSIPTGCTVDMSDPSVMKSAAPAANNAGFEAGVNNAAAGTSAPAGNTEAMNTLAALIAQLTEKNIPTPPSAPQHQTTHVAGDIPPGV